MYILVVFLLFFFRHSTQLAAQNRILKIKIYTWTYHGVYVYAQ